MSSVGNSTVVGVGPRMWPTECPPSEDLFMDACCRIHIPYLNDVGTVGGCDELDVGTHSAVRALHQGDVHYCHAEEGQRIIDYELFRGVVFGDTKISNYLPSGTSRFKRRYCMGAPVGDHVYGAGYCYLRVFEPTVRSRLARCLGPMPLLADVARFFQILGANDGAGVFISSVGGGCYHVGYNGTEYYRPFVHSQMLQILILDPCARVGGDAFEFGTVAWQARVGADEPARSTFGSDNAAWHVCEARLMLEQGLRFGVDSGDDVAVNARLCAKLAMKYVAWNDKADMAIIQQRMKVVDGKPGIAGWMPCVEFSWDKQDAVLSSLGSERWDKFVEWFSVRGMELPVECRVPLLLASASMAKLHDNLSEAKKAVAMWAVLGDNIVKMAHASYAISKHMSPSEYTAMSFVSTNKSMARVLASSGLRDCCLNQGLAVESKANADIFESIVGVLSIYCVNDVLLRFLTATSMLPMDAASVGCFWNFTAGNGRSDVIVGSMNSDQYVKAHQLMLQGII